MKKNKKTILFIASGPAAPGTSKENNPFFHLSSYLNGYVLGRTWNDKSKAEAISYVESLQPHFGDFHYIASRQSTLPSILGFLSDIDSYLREGSRILKKTHIDAIVSYGFLTPGIAASVLSKLFDIPLIVEVPGVPEKAFTIDHPSYIKQKFMNFSASFTLKQASALWTLFPDQLKEFKTDTISVQKVFHEFTSVSQMEQSQHSNQKICFLGFPWHLKGVDTLIQAFTKISSNYPEASLHIAGYCKDKSPYLTLARGFEDKIVFQDSLNHEEARKFISDSSIFVLPSRTEAMGRVLLESMAAGLCVIGSDVDGIPHYIDNNKNGLLFPVEDIDALADRLSKVLSDAKLKEALGKQARKDALTKYSESQFVTQFVDLVEEGILVSKIS